MLSQATVFIKTNFEFDKRQFIYAMKKNKL